MCIRDRCRTDLFLSYKKKSDFLAEIKRLTAFLDLKRKITSLNLSEPIQIGLISYKTIQKCDLEGLEVDCLRGLVRKRGFRPAEYSKISNLVYNDSPNDFLKTYSEPSRGLERFWIALNLVGDANAM